ncbi:MAG TPA: DUF3429 domain-containing protein [Geminicoccaceae bacterium]|nr:DUF3429 domain-containing protein [Geminicoccaceae bacterium]
MPTARLLPDVPAPAAVLGLAGVVPFAAGALGSFWPGALGAFATAALLAYGAVILSFLGGIHWGLAIGQGGPSYRRLGVGVAPSLVGWVALLLGGAGGLLLLAAVFVAVFGLDVQLTRRGMAPAWFPRLRIVLTAAVVLCLLVAALS